MGDDIKKIYDELSSLGRVTVPYDQFADAYTKRTDYKEKIDIAYGELFPELKKKTLLNLLQYLPLGPRVLLQRLIQSR